MKPTSRLMKITAGITFLFFFWQTTTAYALPVVALLPKDIGSVQSDSSQSKPEKTVFFLLNAHTSSDAQARIADLLKFFQSQGIDLIGLEGADEKIDGKIFREFPFKDSLARAAWQMVAEGKFTGAEYYYITAEKLPHFYGLEDKTLYLENRDAFIQTSRRAEELKETLSTLRTSLDVLKKKIYSKRLFNFDRINGLYEQGNLNYLDFLAGVIDTAKHAQTSLPDFPNVYALSKAIEKERRISTTKLRKDLDKIRKNLPKEDIDETIFVLMEGDKSKLQSTDDSLENYKKIYTYFSNLIDQRKIDPKKLSHFSCYFDWLSSFQSFDPTQLFDELNSLIQLIYGRLAKSEKEKTLLKITREFEVLGKMLSIQLTQKEWDAAPSSVFNMESTLSFMKEELGSHAPQPFSPTAKRTEEYQTRSEFGAPQIGPSEFVLVHEALSNAQHFYELAEKRNQVFSEKILREMDLTKKNASVIVVGGFHEKGLQDILKKQGVSTVVISPKIGSHLSDIPYLERMIGKPTQLETVLKQASALENILKVSGIIPHDAQVAVANELDIRAVVDHLFQEGPSSQADRVKEINQAIKDFKVSSVESDNGNFTVLIKRNGKSVAFSVKKSDNSPGTYEITSAELKIPPTIQASRVKSLPQSSRILNYLSRAAVSPAAIGEVITREFYSRSEVRNIRASDYHDVIRRIMRRLVKTVERRPYERQLLTVDNLLRMVAKRFRRHPQTRNLSVRAQANVLNFAKKDFLVQKLKNEGFKKDFEEILDPQIVHNGLLEAALQNPKLRWQLRKERPRIQIGLMDKSLYFSGDSWAEFPDVTRSETPFHFLMMMDQDHPRNYLVFQIVRHQLWLSHSEDQEPHLLTSRAKNMNLAKDPSFQKFDQRMRKAERTLTLGRTRDPFGGKMFAHFKINVQFKNPGIILARRHPAGKRYASNGDNYLVFENVSDPNHPKRVLRLSNYPTAHPAFWIEGVNLKWKERGVEHVQPLLFAMPPRRQGRPTEALKGRPTVNINRILDMIRTGELARKLPGSVKIEVDRKLIRLEAIPEPVYQHHARRYLKGYELWISPQDPYPYRFYPYGFTLGEPPAPQPRTRAEVRKESVNEWPLLPFVLKQASFIALAAVFQSVQASFMIGHLNYKSRESGFDNRDVDLNLGDINFNSSQSFTNIFKPFSKRSELRLNVFQDYFERPLSRESKIVGGFRHIIFPFSAGGPIEVGKTLAYELQSVKKYGVKSSFTSRAEVRADDVAAIRAVYGTQYEKRKRELNRLMEDYQHRLGDQQGYLEVSAQVKSFPASELIPTERIPYHKGLDEELLRKIERTKAKAFQQLGLSDIPVIVFDFGRDRGKYLLGLGSHHQWKLADRNKPITAFTLTLDINDQFESTGFPIPEEVRDLERSIKSRSDSVAFSTEEIPAWQFLLTKLRHPFQVVRDQVIAVLPQLSVADAKEFLKAAQSILRGRDPDWIKRYLEEVTEEIDLPPWNPNILTQAIQQLPAAAGWRNPEPGVPLGERLVVWFNELNKDNTAIGGGKLANLGHLESGGVRVPAGYGTTAKAFQETLAYNNAHEKIFDILKSIDVSDAEQLAKGSEQIQEMIMSFRLPPKLEQLIMAYHSELAKRLGIPEDEIKLAVRSSTTQEDKGIDEGMKLKLGEELTSGSSAGQQKTTPNVLRALIRQRFLESYASLFNAQAISYRDTQGLVDFLLKLTDQERVDLETTFLKNGETREIGRLLREKRPVSRIRLQRAIAQYRRELLSRLNEAYDPYINMSKLSLAVVIQKMLKIDKYYRGFTAMSYDNRTGWTGLSFQLENVEKQEDAGKSVFLEGENVRISEQLKKDAGVPELKKGRVVRLDFNYGLGETVVGGKVSPDTFLVHIFTDAQNHEHVNILEKTRGTKKMQIIDVDEALEEIGLSENDLDELTHFMRKWQEPWWKKLWFWLLGLFKSQTEWAKNVVLLNRLGLKQGQTRSLFKELHRIMSLEFDQVDDYRRPKHLGDLLYGRPDSAVFRLANMIHARLEDPKARVFETFVPLEMRRRFSVTEEEVKRVAKGVKTASDLYGEVRDMEGGLEGRRGELSFVQSRAITTNIELNQPNLVQLQKTVINEAASEQAEKAGRLLGIGVPGRNAIVGETFVLDRDSREPYAKQLKRAQDRASFLAKQGKKLILITRFTAPDDEPAMKVSAGVVAMEGGDTSHAAIVSRELKLATVVGLSEFLDRLRRTDSKRYRFVMKYLFTNGNTLTVDANNGKVYMEALPVETQSVEIDVDRLPRLRFTKPGLIAANPQNMREISKIALYRSDYGVSLQRAEFPLVSIGHPRAFEAYDNRRLLQEGRGDELSEQQLEDIRILNRNPQLIAEIEDRIGGYVDRNGNISAKEFFIQKLQEAIMSMASANGLHNKVLYRFNDFKQNELRQILGGPEFGQVEENTMIGNRGAGWLLHEDNRTALNMEMEALNRAYRAGYTNVGAFYPFVRTPDELKRGLSRFTEFGLLLHNVGMMVELPSNVIQAHEFLDILAQYGQESGKDVFFSFGTNDLTQLTRQAGREEALVRKLFNEADPAVIASIRHVVKVVANVRAKGVNIDCGLCGQAVVKLVDSNPQAAREIISMLDSTGLDILAFTKAVRLIATSELDMGMLSEMALRNARQIGQGSSLQKQGAASRRLVVVEKLSDLEKMYLGDFLLLDQGFQVNLDQDLPEIDPRKMRTVLDRVTRDSFDKNLKQTAVQLKADIPADIEKRQRLFKDSAFRERYARFLMLEAFDQAGAILTADDAPNIFEGLSLRTPQLSNVDTAETKKFDGKLVTIDFETGKIYEGELDITKREVDVEDLVQIVNEPLEPQALEDVVVRARDVYQSFGVHPLVLIQQGREEVFKKGLRTALQSAAQEAKSTDRLLVYQTSDLNSKEYRALKGGEAFTLEEENPALGLGGLYRFVWEQEEKVQKAPVDGGRWGFLNRYLPERYRRGPPPGYHRLLELERDAIAEMAGQLKNNGVKLAVEFTDVRDPQHLKTAIDLFRESLKPQDIQFGVRMDNPDNYLFPNEYIEQGLSFVSVDPRQLSQRYLAADRNNTTVPITDEIARTNLRLPINNIKQAASRRGINFIYRFRSEARGKGIDSAESLGSEFTFKLSRDFAGYSNNSDAGPQDVEIFKNGKPFVHLYWRGMVETRVLDNDLYDRKKVDRYFINGTDSRLFPTESVQLGEVHVDFNFRWEPEQAFSSIYLDFIGVKEKHQGKGVAKAILAWIRFMQETKFPDRDVFGEVLNPKIIPMLAELYPEERILLSAPSGGGMNLLSEFGGVEGYLGNSKYSIETGLTPLNIATVNGTVTLKNGKIVESKLPKGIQVRYRKGRIWLINRYAKEAIFSPVLRFDFPRPQFRILSNQESASRRAEVRAKVDSPSLMQRITNTIENPPAAGSREKNQAKANFGMITPDSATDKMVEKLLLGFESKVDWVREASKDALTRIVNGKPEFADKINAQLKTTQAPVTPSRIIRTVKIQGIEIAQVIRERVLKGVPSGRQTTYKVLQSGYSVDSLLKNDRVLPVKIYVQSFKIYDASENELPESHESVVTQKLAPGQFLVVNYGLPKNVSKEPPKRSEVRSVETIVTFALVGAGLGASFWLGKELQKWRQRRNEKERLDRIREFPLAVERLTELIQKKVPQGFELEQPIRWETFSIEDLEKIYEKTPVTVSLVEGPVKGASGRVSFMNNEAQTKPAAVYQDLLGHLEDYRTHRTVVINFGESRRAEVRTNLNDQDIQALQFLLGDDYQKTLIHEEFITALREKRSSMSAQERVAADILIEKLLLIQKKDAEPIPQSVLLKGLIAATRGIVRNLKKAGEPTKLKLFEEILDLAEDAGTTQQDLLRFIQNQDYHADLYYLEVVVGHSNPELSKFVRHFKFAYLKILDQEALSLKKIFDIISQTIEASKGIFVLDDNFRSFVRVTISPRRTFHMEIDFSLSGDHVLVMIGEKTYRASHNPRVHLLLDKKSEILEIFDALLSKPAMKKLRISKKTEPKINPVKRLKSLRNTFARAEVREESLDEHEFLATLQKEGEFRGGVKLSSNREFKNQETFDVPGWGPLSIEGDNWEIFAKVHDDLLFTIEAYHGTDFLLAEDPLFLRATVRRWDNQKPSFEDERINKDQVLDRFLFTLLDGRPDGRASLFDVIRIEAPRAIDRMIEIYRQTKDINRSLDLFSPFETRGAEAAAQIFNEAGISYEDVETRAQQYEKGNFDLRFRKDLHLEMLIQAVMRQNTITSSDDSIMLKESDLRAGPSAALEPMKELARGTGAIFLEEVARHMRRPEARSEAQTGGAQPAKMTLTFDPKYTTHFVDKNNIEWFTTPIINDAGNSSVHDLLRVAGFEDLARAMQGGQLWNYGIPKLLEYKLPGKEKREIAAIVVEKIDPLTSSSQGMYVVDLMLGTSGPYVDYVSSQALLPGDRVIFNESSDFASLSPTTTVRVTKTTEDVFELEVTIPARAEVRQTPTEFGTPLSFLRSTKRAEVRSEEPDKDLTARASILERLTSLKKDYLTLRNSLNKQRNDYETRVGLFQERFEQLVPSLIKFEKFTKTSERFKRFQKSFYKFQAGQVQLIYLTEQIELWDKQMREIWRSLSALPNQPILIIQIKNRTIKELKTAQAKFERLIKNMQQSVTRLNPAMDERIRTFTEMEEALSKLEEEFKDLGGGRAEVRVAEVSKSLTSERRITEIVFAEDQHGVLNEYRSDFTARDLPKGVRMSYFENGEEALTYIRETHATNPQAGWLIITDVVMPQMSGYTLVDESRKLLGYPAPVIFASSGKVSLSLAGNEYDARGKIIKSGWNQITAFVVQTHPAEVRMESQEVKNQIKEILEDPALDQKFSLNQIEFLRNFSTQEKLTANDIVSAKSWIAQYENPVKPRAEVRATLEDRIRELQGELRGLHPEMVVSIQSIVDNEINKKKSPKLDVATIRAILMAEGFERISEDTFRKPGRAEVRTEARAEPKPVSLERAEEFANELSEIYYLVDQEEIGRFVIKEIFQSLHSEFLPQLLEKIKNSQEILEWAADIHSKFPDLISQMKVAEAPDFSDLLFTEAGEAVMVLGSSTSGKSSLAIAAQEPFSIGGESDHRYVTIDIPGYLLAGSLGHLDKIRAWAFRTEITNPEERWVTVTKQEPMVTIVRSVVFLERSNGKQSDQPDFKENEVTDLSFVPHLGMKKQLTLPIQLLHVSHGATDAQSHRKLAAQVIRHVTDFIAKQSGPKTQPPTIPRAEVRTNRQEVQSLNLSPLEPVRFFIRALGINPDKANSILLGEDDKGYGVVPLRPSSTLDRLVKFLKKHSPNPDEILAQKPEGWLLTFGKKPLGIVVKVKEASFEFVDLISSLQSLSPEEVKMLNQRRLDFNLHFETFLKQVYGEEKFPRQSNLTDVPDSVPIFSWQTLSIPGYEPSLSLPVWLDVFPPSTPYARELLKSTLPKIGNGKRFLIIGTGAGPEAVWIAKIFKDQGKEVQVHAVDINQLEVENTKASAAYHQVTDRVRAWQSDGFKNVSGRYDFILIDPPFPTSEKLSKHDEHDVRTEDPEAEFFMSILAGLEDHLNKRGGALYMVLPLFSEPNGFLSVGRKHVDYERIDSADNKVDSADKKEFGIYEFRLAGQTTPQVPSTGPRAEVRANGEEEDKYEGRYYVDRGIRTFSAHSQVMKRINEKINFGILQEVQVGETRIIVNDQKNPSEAIQNEIFSQFLPDSDKSKPKYVRVWSEGDKTITIKPWMPDFMEGFPKVAPPEAQTIDWQVIEKLWTNVEEKNWNDASSLSQYLARLYAALPRPSFYPRFNELAGKLETAIKKPEPNSTKVEEARGRLEAYVFEAYVGKLIGRVERAEVRKEERIANSAEEIEKLSAKRYPLSPKFPRAEVRSEIASASRGTLPRNDERIPGISVPPVAEIRSATTKVEVDVSGVEETQTVPTVVNGKVETVVLGPAKESAVFEGAARVETGTFSVIPAQKVSLNIEQTVQEFVDLILAKRKDSKTILLRLTEDEVAILNGQNDEKVQQFFRTLESLYKLGHQITVLVPVGKENDVKKYFGSLRLPITVKPVGESNIPVVERVLARNLTNEVYVMTEEMAEAQAMALNSNVQKSKAKMIVTEQVQTFHDLKDHLLAKARLAVEAALLRENAFQEMGDDKNILVPNSSLFNVNDLINSLTLFNQAARHILTQA